MGCGRCGLEGSWECSQLCLCQANPAQGEPKMKMGREDGPRSSFFFFFSLSLSISLSLFALHDGEEPQILACDKKIHNMCRNQRRQRCWIFFLQVVLKRVDPGPNFKIVF